MEKRQYVCPKCGCTEYEADRLQATGGNFAKLFDVQNKSLSPSAAASAAILSCTNSRVATAGMCSTS